MDLEALFAPPRKRITLRGSDLEEEKKRKRMERLDIYKDSLFGYG